MKEISVQLELKCIQAQNLKIKLTNSLRRPRFVLDRARLSGCLVFSAGGPAKHSCSFAGYGLFSLLFLHLAILLAVLDLTARFFAAITIRRCSTATARLRANSMGYFCCGRFGCQKLLFHLVGGMTQLTAALMRCDKLSKL